jgi:hypothetical protein
LFNELPCFGLGDDVVDYHAAFEREGFSGCGGVAGEEGACGYGSEGSEVVERDGKVCGMKSRLTSYD